MKYQTPLIATTTFLGVIVLIGIYQYAFNSDGDLFDALQSSSAVETTFHENTDRINQIHTTTKETNQSFYLRPWTTGCINTLDTQCVEKSALDSIGLLAFKTDPKFKQVEHLKEFGESTWFTFDERKHFDKRREIGIVLVDDPDSFIKTLHDSPFYENIDQLDKHITEHPTATSYAFARIENGVYVFYQYTPY